MAATITPESVWAHIPPRARNSHKGSFGAVLVVAGSPPRETAAVTLEEGTEQVLRLVAQGIRLKDAAREVSAHTGLSKNELYAAALERS